MKNLLTKTLFISLFLSAVMPSDAQVNLERKFINIQDDLKRKVSTSRNKAVGSLEEAVLVSILVVAVVEKSIGIEEAVLVGLLALGKVGLIAFEVLTDVIIETNIASTDASIKANVVCLEEALLIHQEIL